MRASFLRVLDSRPFKSTASRDDMKLVFNAVNKYDCLLLGKSEKEENDVKDVLEAIRQKVGGVPELTKVKTLNQMVNSPKVILARKKAVF